jgi:predicted anti-sigma-YlaC factor YlaD
MNCLSDDILNNYIDNERGIAELNFIEEHLKTCTVCKNKLNNLQAVHLSLQKIEEYSPSEEFTAVFMRKIGKSTINRKNQERFFAFVLSTIIIVFILIVAYLIWAFGDTTASEPKISIDFMGILTLYYNALFGWVKELLVKQNFAFMGSVFSLIILASGYYFYETRKAYKKL